MSKAFDFLTRKSSPAPDGESTPVAADAPKSNWVIDAVFKHLGISQEQLMVLGPAVINGVVNSEARLTVIEQQMKTIEENQRKIMVKLGIMNPVPELPNCESPIAVDPQIIEDTTNE